MADAPDDITLAAERLEALIEEEAAAHPGIDANGDTAVARRVRVICGDLLFAARAQGAHCKLCGL